jgi:hypothetical protein
MAVPNTHNLATTITDKQNKYQELANENICYVEAKGSTIDPDSNIAYGSNSKVTIAKSNKTPIHIYNCKNVLILGTCSVVKNFLNYK